MKKLLFLFCLAACSQTETRNELMSDLLVRKKEVESKIDSIKNQVKHENSIVDTMVTDDEQLNEEIRVANERANHLKLFKERLKDINFSIDSLSKMK